MSQSLLHLGTLGYAVAALAFFVLGLLLARSRPVNLRGGLLAGACFASALWTGALAQQDLFRPLPDGVTVGLEFLRTAVWIGFLVSLLHASFRPQGGAFRLGRVRIAAGTLVTALLAIAVFGLGPLQSNAIIAPPLAGLGLAVFGILVLETLHRNIPDEQRWSMKFLSLAVGGLFAYDLFLYGDAMLFARVDATLVEARGAVQALAVPMLAIAAVRNDMWRTDIAFSRKLVVHSTALIASGLYLMLMAVAGYLLREIDETRGPVIQVIFFAGAAAVLAIILMSGTSWAYLKVWVSRHFFKSRYDWRAEWLRFMDTLSVGQSRSAIEERAIKALADIMESPGGGMWLRDGVRFVQVSAWNFPSLPLIEDREGPLVAFLRRSRRVVDLSEARRSGEHYPGLSIPSDLQGAEDAWLIVPLWHYALIGFVVLARPRAPRALGWEDFDLLGIVGRQIASYLSERKAVQALDEAREFEIFNRRFAFVVHDIKNLVSHLSLIGSNFEKFGDNKDFRDDVAKSLAEASDRMKRLMARIDTRIETPALQETVPLGSLLESILRAKGDIASSIEIEGDVTDLAVTGDRDRLEAVIEHLIENALESVANQGMVRVVLHDHGTQTVIDIVDDGPGMNVDFVHHELFKPFRSTKNGGMGIGAFQCREYVRELGGNLDVISAPGKGTTMRVTLPLSKGRAEQSGEAEAVETK